MVRAGTAAQVAVIFFDGSVTLMDKGAELSIDRLQGSRESGFSSVELFQAGGRTIHRVQKLVDADSAYVMRTSSSVGVVRGTGFIVEDDPVQGTKWKSFEGVVGLAGETGVVVNVEPGESSFVPPGADPEPPIPDPLTPDEAVVVEEVDDVIEENEVEPPPAKDPAISTPVPGPTATLPPLPPPPPEPVAGPDISVAAVSVSGAPPPSPTVPLPTPPPTPPAAARNPDSGPPGGHADAGSHTAG